MTSPNIKTKDNSKENNKSIFPLNIKINRYKKCGISKYEGLITPKDSDIFPTISLTEKTEQSDDENSQNNSNINILKVNIVDNEKKVFWSYNPFSINLCDNKENKENKEPNTLSFKAKEECIRTINKDSVESIIQCKPMLNSTASKSFMQEYFCSKKFQEDLKILMSTNSIVVPEISNKKSSPSPSNDSLPGVAEEDEDSFNDIRKLIKYQEEHLPVPKKEKDNENYKILTMKKMKRKTMPPNKSVRKFAEDREPQYEREFRINNSFCKLLKRKVVHSYKRIYASNFILADGKKQLEFPIFRDKDIGIYEYWQAHIHEAYNDEDVETDEEQKTLAKCYTLGELKEAFMAIKNRDFEDIFVNFDRYHDFRSKNENERIKKEMLNLKNKISK